MAGAGLCLSRVTLSLLPSRAEPRLANRNMLPSRPSLSVAGDWGGESIGYGTNFVRDSARVVLWAVPLAVAHALLLAPALLLVFGEEASMGIRNMPKMHGERQSVRSLATSREPWFCIICPIDSVSHTRAPQVETRNAIESLLAWSIFLLRNWCPRCLRSPSRRGHITRGHLATPKSPSTQKLIPLEGEEALEAYNPPGG